VADPEISKAKLKVELEAVLALQATVAYHQWEIVIDGLMVYVTMHPRNAPNKKYLARFTYDDFPQRAPAFTFVDPDTRKDGKEFWPKHGEFNNAVNRQPPQLCIAGVREFHEILHREHPWSPERYPLAKALESIQAELTKGHPAG
jgi:hypothetical protein